MGACCTSGTQDFSRFEGLDQDLPEPNLQGIKDQYKRFELQLPFARTLLSRFLEKLDAAEKANGEQGFVTPETLRTQLDTQAWLGLENPESGIYKLLVSDLFKDPKKKQEGNQIDSEILRIAGVIHC